MKMKKFLFGFLALMFVFTACNDEIVEPDITQQGGGIIEVDFDMDLLAETYGPALTRSIQAQDLPSAFALPIDVSSLTMTPNSAEITASGEDRTIVAIGTFTVLSLRARDIVNEEVIAENIIVNTGTYGIGTLRIPAYESTVQGSVRVVLFEYYNYNTNGWEHFFYATQYAVYQEPFEAWTNIAGDIPKAGGEYMVYISGKFPSVSNDYVFFRVIDKNNQPVTSTFAIMGTTQKSEKIIIPAYTGSSTRILYFQYMKSDESDWTTYEMHVQLP